MNSLLDDCYVERGSRYRENRCDPFDPFSSNDDWNIKQGEDTQQISNEFISIRNSCDVDVRTMSTQASASIQSSVQTAILLITEIAIGDTVDKDGIREELYQLIRVRQITNQKTLVDNSKNVTVWTNDTNTAVAAQVATQTLTALLVILDIL